MIFDGGGAQLQLPDMLWPAGVDLPDEPLYFGSMPLADANALLDRWKHPLGQYRRPFGYQAWGLAVEGRAAAVVVSGSTVSKRVDGDLHRRNTVELARIARAPDHPYVMRAMLRLWRDYLARRWPYWPVDAAISYALPGKLGNLYRFAGWRKVGQRAPSGGRGTWSGRPAAAVLSGPNTLYAYDYQRAGPPTDIHDASKDA